MRAYIQPAPGPPLILVKAILFCPLRRLDYVGWTSDCGRELQAIAGIDI
jgi:hypothetical protein